MVHWGLIVAHAALAVLAFGLGCSLLVTLPQGPRSGRFVGYAGCVWLAMLALIVVVAVDWTDAADPEADRLRHPVWIGRLPRGANRAGA